MKNYERRFVVEYLELSARIKNLEEYIERRNLDQDEGKCDIAILLIQLNTMKKYKSILEVRADIEKIDFESPEW